MSSHTILADFLADVVMTGYYLAEPVRKTDAHLHDAEMKCLKIIHTFQPLPIQAIARAMHCGKARASQLVHNLEEKQYICRSAATDHRVALIQTTDTGSAVVQEVRKKYLALAQHIEEKLGTEDAAYLAKLIEKITPLTTQERTKTI